MDNTQTNIPSFPTEALLEQLKEVVYYQIIDPNYNKIAAKLVETDETVMTKGVDIQDTKMLLLSNGNKLSVGETLKEVLICARDDRRLTIGLYESGLMLETNPDAVMLCVLPTNKSEDVTLDIHYTLIEAFCLENEIGLIKIDSKDKISKLLGDRPTQNPTMERRLSEIDDNYYTDEDEQDDTVDFNCILIEEPAKKFTEHEQSVLAFYRDTSCDYPQPIVELAV